MIVHILMTIVIFGESCDPSMTDYASLLTFLADFKFHKVNLSQLLNFFEKSN